METTMTVDAPVLFALIQSVHISEAVTLELNSRLSEHRERDFEDGDKLVGIRLIHPDARPSLIIPRSAVSLRSILVKK